MTNSRTPGILVTGPTGNIGRELTKELSAQNVLFRAMVRSRKGADALVTLKGVETRGCLSLGYSICKSYSRRCGPRDEQAPATAYLCLPCQSHKRGAPNKTF